MGTTASKVAALFAFVSLPLLASDQASPTVTLSVSGYNMSSDGSVFYYCDAWGTCTVRWSHGVIDSTTGAA